MRFFKLLVIALMTIVLLFASTDLLAAKYKSSSSKSSFSSRPVSRPAVSAPKPQPYTRPVSRDTDKYNSTSSGKHQSASSFFSQKQAETKSKQSYASTTQQKSTYYSQSSSQPKSTYQSKQTYSNSRSQPKPDTVIVNNGTNLGDVMLGAVLANAFTSSASAQSDQQVAKLEREVQELKHHKDNEKMNGTAPVNPATVAKSAPKPVPQVPRENLPILKFCAGQPNLNYYNYGTILHYKAREYNVEIVTTNGSIDNLNKLKDGSCDAAIVQRDSYELVQGVNINRISSPYGDEAILMCTNASNIVNITDIKPSTRMTSLPVDSGSHATWSKLEKKYNINPTKTITTNNREQLIALNSGKADCAFMVTTKNAPVFRQMKGLNMAQTVSTVHIPVEAVEDIKDPANVPIYYGTRIHYTDSFQFEAHGTFFGYKLYKTSAKSIIIPNDVILSEKAMKLPFIDRLIADVDSIKI